MSTFDEILPNLTKIFYPFQEDVTKMKPILVNRDLNGRVRLIVDEKWEGDESQQIVLEKIAQINKESSKQSFEVLEERQLL